jgi:hypothetical protein
MKKFLTFALIATLVAALFVPVFSVPAQAADGELLIAVNWLTDPLYTLNVGTGVCQDFKEKYDLSKCTADMLFPIPKTTDSAINKTDLCYVEDSGYYITDNTKYTIYFEAASPHLTRYSGITMYRENNEYGSIIMLYGHFSEYGDTYEDDGTRYTELGYAYDFSARKNNIGDGYDDKESIMLCHPALSTEDLGSQGLVDTCKDGEPVSEFKFSTIKIEFDGLNITTWYLDADRNWHKADSYGSEVTLQAPWGSEILLGVECRDHLERHNICRNLKLLQGTGLTYDQIWTAKQTTEPKPPKPVAAESTAPETKAPETKAPETKAPETKAPETQAPETQAPATEAPKEEKKGCGDFAALLPVVAVAATGTVVFRRKRK